jgi:hypothetical protein
MRSSAFAPAEGAAPHPAVRDYEAARAAWARVAFLPWTPLEDRFDGPEGRAYVAAYSGLCAAVRDSGGVLVAGDVTYRLDRSGGVEIYRMFESDNVWEIPKHDGAGDR